MRKYFSVIFLVFCLNFVAQNNLPKNASKLIGTWVYEAGSGFEVWTKVDINGASFLNGTAYRSSRFNDTLQLEDITIYKEENHFYYVSVIAQKDNTIIRKQFKSRKSKLLFYNPSRDLPYSIAYKFNCFNKNKLKIIIQHTPKSKATVLKLRRKKD